MRNMNRIPTSSDTLCGITSLSCSVRNLVSVLIISFVFKFDSYRDFHPLDPTIGLTYINSYNVGNQTYSNLFSQRFTCDPFRSIIFVTHVLVSYRGVFACV